MRLPYLVFLVFIITASTAVDGGLWPKKVFVYRGSTPTLDGVIGQDEYADAVALDDFSGWTPQFSPVARSADLDATVWIKHDGRDFYFAFDVTDDLIYGTDTERWLPDGNSDAHSLTPQGWPWLGDGVELLLNAAYRWNTIDGQIAWGDGSSWQMVASTHKSRMGGLDRGGLLAGEPRNRDHAWTKLYRLDRKRRHEGVCPPQRPGNGGQRLCHRMESQP